MNLAALALLTLVFGLVAFDWATLRGKNRRAVLLESVAFVVGAFFIVFPHRATELAHLVGIGRGVDFLLYPIVIWLVRESLLTRRRRLEDAERLTSMARALAIAEARVVGVGVGVGAHSGASTLRDPDGHSPAVSASTSE